MEKKKSSLRCPLEAFQVRAPLHALCFSPLFFIFLFLAFYRQLFVQLAMGTNLSKPDSKHVASTAAVALGCIATVKLVKTVARACRRTRPIEGFTGEMYWREDGGQYDDKRYQYATTSRPNLDMSPKAVLYANTDADIIAAIKYAKEKGVALAVRSGGHHYSGMSSTSGENIQLDMSSFTSIEYPWSEKKLFRVGAGCRLKDMSAAMKKRGMFVPRGACAYVAVGGHCQTGGYSAVPRAFGLFSDYVQSIRIITADCKIREIARDTKDPDDAELFWAVIGGSPGNFGIITHVAIKPCLEADHPNVRCFSGLFTYNEELLERLTKVFCELNDNCDDIPADYDLTFLPLGAEHPAGLYGGWLTRSEDERQDGWAWVLAELAFHRPVSILVLATWSNLGGKDQVYDPENNFFKRIKWACDVPGIKNFWAFPGCYNDDKPQKLATVLEYWTLLTKREFDLPYQKFGLVSASRQLSKSGFEQWFVARVKEVCAPKGKTAPIRDVTLSGQLALLGGKHSKFANPPDNRSSCSQRDAVSHLEMDLFYAVCKGPRPALEAQEWVARLVREANGDNGVHSVKSRRLLWAPFACDKDLHEAREMYYSHGVYDRLSVIKSKVDPSNVFTPNKFAVRGRASE